MDTAVIADNRMMHIIKNKLDFSKLALKKKLYNQKYAETQAKTQMFIFKTNEIAIPTIKKQWKRKIIFRNYN